MTPQLSKCLSCTSGGTVVVLAVPIIVAALFPFFAIFLFSLLSRSHLNIAVTKSLTPDALRASTVFWIYHRSWVNFCIHIISNFCTWYVLFSLWAQTVSILPNGKSSPAYIMTLFT